MSLPDPPEPTWVLDLAEQLVAERADRLIAWMLRSGEDPSNTRLYKQRLAQLNQLLQSGRVLLVLHGAEKSRQEREYMDMAYYRTSVTVTYREPGASEPVKIEIDFPAHHIWASSTESARQQARIAAALLLKKKIVSDPNTEIQVTAYFDSV